MPHFQLNFDEATHAYSDDKGPLISVTQVFEAAGIVDKRVYTPGSADRGKALHKLFELYDKGTLDWATIPEGAEGYLEQWAKAKKELPPIGIEAHEYKIGHQLLRVAGTVDKTNGHDVFLEVKTGRPERYHILQLSAYWKLWEWWDDCTVDKAWIIYVHKDDYKLMPFDSCPPEWEIFLAALEVAKWKKHGKV